MTSTVAQNLSRIQREIHDACRACGRDPASVRLVAASKGQPVSAILAAVGAGQRIFGENYAKEMREKRFQIDSSEKNLEWHFIGRVQANNAKDIAAAALVHGVGSLDQLDALARRGRSAGAAVPILLQVSLWGEQTKNGFREEELRAKIDALRETAGTSVRGLMAMPPPHVDARRAFAEVRRLRDSVVPDLPELSMGMSADFGDAILEGATLVRVGTALFGPRSASKENA